MKRLLLLGLMIGLPIITALAAAPEERPTQDFTPQELASPPMPLTQKLHVELTAENREKYLSRKDNAAKNLQLIQNKAIPWLPIATTIAIVSVILLIKLMPPPPAREAKVADAINPIDKAMGQLDQLSLDNPAYFSRLDHIVREYIEDQYAIQAPTLTTQEFLLKASRQADFEPTLKEALAHFLHATDKVKFARHAPTLNEKEKGMLLAKHIIQHKEGEGHKS